MERPSLPPGSRRSYSSSAPPRHPGRAEFKGRIEGSVNYNTGMKGITTEDLKSETAAGCDGAIGPESEVKFSLNKLTVQPSTGESVDIDMGDELPGPLRSHQRVRRFVQDSRAPSTTAARISRDRASIVSRMAEVI